MRSASRQVAHPPIVEHVFEVRWGHPSGRGPLYDEYELALGRLYDSLRAKFRHRERTGSHLPREVFETLQLENLVFDRFVPQPTTDRLSYPLVQYGPGIASCNVDKANYAWSGVRADILDVFAKLAAVHEVFEDRVSEDSLRAIDFFETEDPASFIRRKLKVTITSDLPSTRLLRDAVEIPRFQSRWTLAAERTELTVSIGSGSLGARNGVFLDISARSSGATLRDRRIDDLLGFQHQLTGDAFFALLTAELHNELGPTH